jgi:hypothetical protein
MHPDVAAIDILTRRASPETERFFFRRKYGIFRRAVSSFLDAAY